MNDFKSSDIAFFISGATIGFTIGAVMIAKTVLKTDTISNKIIMIYKNNKPKGSVGRTSYHQYFDDAHRNRTAYSDVWFSTRSEGEKVIYSLQNTIFMYGHVSVADLCDLTSLTSTYQDNFVGWTNLDAVKLFKIKTGYILNLPKPIRIN